MTRLSLSPKWGGGEAGELPAPAAEELQRADLISACCAATLPHGDRALSGTITLQQAGLPFYSEQAQMSGFEGWRREEQGEGGLT